jgi:ketosteroid isomerase-like protein
MSQENVEIVRRIYDVIVASPEAVRELYTSDYELDVTDIGPDIVVIRGFDAANEALRSYFETFEDFYIEIEEVVHADEERVVTEVHDGGRMPGSDSEIRNHRFHVFAFRGDKVARFSSHLDRDRALEAAGLSE